MTTHVCAVINPVNDTTDYMNNITELQQVLKSQTNTCRLEPEIFIIWTIV